MLLAALGQHQLQISKGGQNGIFNDDAKVVHPSP